MKKFYSLALAVAAGSMALSAQAPQKAAQLNAEDAPVAVATATSSTNNITLAPQKADAELSIFGDYIYSFHSCLNGHTSENRIVTITKGEGNAVIISGLFDEEKIQGNYNPADETITIKPQIPFINKQNSEAGVLEIFDWSGESPVPVKGDIVLNYKGGVLSFKDAFTIIGVGVHKGTFSEENITAGEFLDKYYFLNNGNFFLNKATVFNPIGKTNFTNNFFNPVFGAAVTNKPVEVTVAKCATNGSIFVVLGAFGAFGADYNGQMIIDATDPKIVRVPVQNSGVVGEQDGITWYGSVSCISTTLAQYNAAITNQKLGGGAITSTGDKIEFTKSACRFNWPKSPTESERSKWYYTSGSTNCTLNLPGEAGIEDVISDSENAPVEYFNLQGVKIQNPAEGQIVIRRQGSKVTKVVM